MNETEIRQAIKAAGVKLLDNGLVNGTWGNISVRIDDRYMMVTPSGIDYIRLKPEQMVKVDIDTLEYDSAVKPTSEKRIHAAIYAHRPDVGAVIHSHPLWCSSVAAARREMPVQSAEMERLVGGSARSAAYAFPGTKKLMEGAIAALDGGRNACFLSNHGMIACAGTLDEAFEVCRIMEESAKLFILKEAGAILGKEASDSDDIIQAFTKLNMENK